MICYIVFKKLIMTLNCGIRTGLSTLLWGMASDNDERCRPALNGPLFCSSNVYPIAQHVLGWKGAVVLLKMYSRGVFVFVLSVYPIN